MKGSIKIPLGQLESSIELISPIDLYNKTSYVEGKTYVIPEKETGFLATTENDLIRIWGDGEIFDPFTLKIDASDSNFTIPTNGSNYNYRVDWGDGNVINGYTGDASHAYSAPGEYVVKIYGTFNGIYFNNSGDRLKVLEIQQWGDVVWGSMARAFWGCSNMDCTATDYPNLSGVSDMEYMFSGCNYMTSIDVSNWDVSSVTTFNAAFRACTSLTTLDVSNWDVSSVTNMVAAFNGCTSLTTLDISNWDVSSVTSMLQMFFNTGSLMIDIKNWNVSNVANFGQFKTGGGVIDYDEMLCNWSMLALQPNLTVSFGGQSKYSPTGDVCRTDIINTHGWTINDGGPA